MRTDTEINGQIKALKAQKHDNAIRRTLKESCYDQLFFTYEAHYKKKVHFAYLANQSCYDAYAILCKEGDWLHDGQNDEGHHLDMIELLEKDAVFMDWNEAVRNLCSKCIKYLPLNQVVLNYTKALRVNAAKTVELALNRQRKLNEKASRLESTQH